MTTLPISPDSSFSSAECNNHQTTRRRRQQRRQQQRRSFFGVTSTTSLVVFAVTLLILQNVGTTVTAKIASPISTISRSTSTLPRGGAGAVLFGTATEEDDEEKDNNDDDDDEKENDIRHHPEYEKLQAYRMKQQVLLQLRATFLSESLAKRGLPLPTIRDVSLPDGRVPPQNVDWDCALSTEDDPKHCLISYEPEHGSKLVVPMELAGTDKWITLSALNRLRRDDPSKVEPMWSDKYAVLNSWFSPNSRYSLLQHVGPKGVLLSALLDGNRLEAVVGVLVILATILFLPVIEVVVNRFLVSGFLWMKWASWHRYIHIGLPFKLLILQTIFAYAAKAFGSLTMYIKDKLVDLECRILEDTIPLTVGVPDGGGGNNNSNLNMNILDKEEEEVIKHLEEDESSSSSDYEDLDE